MRLPTVTETLVPPPTDTPTPTDTQLPTASPTPEASPTPNLSRFFTMPPTLKDFPQGQESYNPDILAALHRGPSLLTEGSPAPIRGKIVNVPGGSYFTVQCNKGGIINCAPAAYMNITKQNVQINIIFFEIRNKDGSRAYKVDYYSDSSKINIHNSYNLFVDHPNDIMELTFTTSISTAYASDFVDAMFIFQQPGFLQNDQEWIDTGNIPKSSEGQIELMYN